MDKKIYNELLNNFNVFAVRFISLLQGLALVKSWGKTISCSNVRFS